jgi:uncharacterized lipoprotein YmbA
MNFFSRLRRRSAPGILSAIALGVSGCSLLPQPKADPTRYYVLTGQPVADAPAPKAEGALVLGVKHIEIASYLNGKDMIVRQTSNEITYNGFSRWAEPLAASIGRAVAGSLAGSPVVKRVYAQPFPFDVARDYDVSVRVMRCEGARTADGGLVASFSALVEVTEAKAGGAVVWRKLFTAPETPWDGRDFGALAVALSEQVAALGAEVTAALPAAAPAR